MSDTPSAIPTEPADPLPELSFAELPDRLREAAGRAGWTSLMPVQARALPYLLAGRNMIVQARTGSGKTGAFLLPMLERIDPEMGRPQVLILVPTRELARQVWQDAETLFGGSGLKAAVVYGGVGYGEQIDALRGGAQIVIGTPGRVLDLLLKRHLSLADLKLLIFDEADRMLSMGFYPDMKRIQRYLPKRDLHACMFSATFPGYVLATSREFIPQADFLSLSREKVHVTDIQHLYYEVPGMDKDRTLVRLIELENPSSAIIFCNTKVRVHYVTVVLQRFGYDADELSADLSQKDRERVLDRVRRGTLRFLVATDVAARGLDIPELSHVFQFEPPEDPEAYVHRAGRTGRAGASGTAITLVGPIERLELNRIAKRFGIEMEERPLPTDADVEAVVSQRLTALLEARLRERDKLHVERSQRFVALGRSLAESEDEVAIIAMLLDEYYQESLHAPVPHPEPSAHPAQRQGPRKPDRPERGNRQDRGESHERGDRRDRGDRSGRGDRPGPSDRAPSAEPVETTQGAERTVQPTPAEISAQPETPSDAAPVQPEAVAAPEPPAKPTQPEKTDKPAKAARAARPTKAEKPAKAEKPEKPAEAEKAERSVKGAKPRKTTKDTPAPAGAPADVSAAPPPVSSTDASGTDESPAAEPPAAPEAPAKPSRPSRAKKPPRTAAGEPPAAAQASPPVPTEAAPAPAAETPEPAAAPAPAPSGFARWRRPRM